MDAGATREAGDDAPESTVVHLNPARNGQGRGQECGEAEALARALAALPADERAAVVAHVADLMSLPSKLRRRRLGMKKA